MAAMLFQSFLTTRNVLPKRGFMEVSFLQATDNQFFVKNMLKTEALKNHGKLTCADNSKKIIGRHRCLFANFTFSLPVRSS